MNEVLIPVVVALLVVAIVLLLVLLQRQSRLSLTALPLRLDALEKGGERAERGLKDEISRNREESSNQARGLREEVSGSLKNLSESMIKSLGEIASAQQQHLQTFAEHLARTNEASQVHAKQLREELALSLKGFNDSVLKQMADVAMLQKNQLESFAERLTATSRSAEQKLEAMRGTVESKLSQIQQDNATKLEEMRRTVDEKLQGALEKRLGESFKLVSDRLEQVHKGLGEMQTLANGVGDLKKVLTNVKTRGTWGEVQLGNLLEQILTQDQFDRNVIMKEGSVDRVEFAIRLPEGEDGKAVWLPIDAKFPKEDYERLIEASERADTTALEEASKQLEARIKAEAKNIRDKYIAPPHTTDFGILFLSTEGLYAEVLRRPGLADLLQREYRVVLAGPTTLYAILNSFQMGFRTLAIRKRSSEVWMVLGAVKTEFGKFGDVIRKVQDKLEDASSTIDREVAVRTRAIERKLRTVQEIPAAEGTALLGTSEAPLDDPDELPNLN